MTRDASRTRKRLRTLRLQSPKETPPRAQREHCHRRRTDVEHRSHLHQRQTLNAAVPQRETPAFRQRIQRPRQQIHAVDHGEMVCSIRQLRHNLQRRNGGLSPRPIHCDIPHSRRQIGTKPGLRSAAGSDRLKDTGKRLGNKILGIKTQRDPPRSSQRRKPVPTPQLPERANVTLACGHDKFGIAQRSEEAGRNRTRNRHESTNRKAQLLPAAQTTYGYFALHSGGIDIWSRRTRQRSRSTGGRKGVELREYLPVIGRGACAWQLPKKR